MCLKRLYSDYSAGLNGADNLFIITDIFFNVISILHQAFLLPPKVQSLKDVLFCSAITQEAGTAEYLQLHLETLLKLEQRREQILSSRLTLLTTLTLDREEVWLLRCHEEFKNRGPDIPDPTQLVLQPIS